MVAEKFVLRCAIADLIGAYQAVVIHNDPCLHDWESHKKTIQELIDEYPFLAEEFDQSQLK